MCEVGNVVAVQVAMFWGSKYVCVAVEGMVEVFAVTEGTRETVELPLRGPRSNRGWLAVSARCAASILQLPVFQGAVGWAWY